MANLKPPRGGETQNQQRDRGQILLVAAFILAAAFVVLALVVNSAIFTENLATRDEVPGSHDALEYRAEVVDGVGNLVVATNEDPDIEPGEDALALDTIAEVTSLDQSTMGRVVSVSYLDHTEGLRVAQDNENRNLTDRAGNESWTVLEDVSAVRHLQFHLDVVDSDGPFEVVANDTDGEDWKFELAVGDTVGDAYELTVTEPGGTEATCENVADQQILTLDVTGGTIDGEPCQAVTRLQDDGTEMWFTAGLEGDEYDLEFRGADTVVGTYSLVTDATDHAVTGNVTEEHSPDEPYSMDAIYSVEVQFEYYTSAVGYESSVRVAPGEVPP